MSEKQELQAQTLAEAFRLRVERSPHDEAYRQWDPGLEGWASYSWSEMGHRVARWKRALEKESLAPGARVAILVPNSIEHVCMDQAALALGMVPVPLHATDNPESIAFILGDSGASVLLVDSAARWSELAPLWSRFPQLRRAVCLGKSGAEGCVGIESWLDAAADERRDGPPDLGESPASPGSLAAIVYTSGTTGRPKGVMLSHRNVCSNVQMLLELVSVSTDDRFLSFLPLSHTFERTVGYYLPIAAGACVVYTRSIQQLAEDLRSVRPTVLVSVPRIYERVHARVQEQLASRGHLATLLFRSAERVGWSRFARAQGGRAPAAWLDGLLWPVLDRAVAARLREQFGGRVRFAITGGAPLGESVARAFLALGLPLLQGYGMTETGPVVSANTPDDNDPHSVGRPLVGVEVKIGPDDELLVKGPNVMGGYWGRPEDSASAFDADGWLRTGDQARLEGGRIYIKGRIKDILVTSTGEKIAPADLELAITADPLFAQAMVLGEGRPFLSALLVVEPAVWSREAASLGVDPADLAQLNSAPARKLALARVRQAVRAFPVYATPRALYLTAEPWTIAQSLITPTLKLKRPALQERFASEIRALYSGH